METKDCYTALGVNASMSIDKIHDVYRKLCKKYHPDLFDNENEKMEAHEKFILIDAAYRTLLKNHIDSLEEKKRIGDLVDIILKNMELRMKGMDRAAGQLDNIFWSSVLGVGMLIATGVLLVKMSPILGIQ